MKISKNICNYPLHDFLLFSIFTSKIAIDKQRMILQISPEIKSLYETITALGKFALLFNEEAKIISTSDNANEIFKVKSLIGKSVYDIGIGLQNSAIEELFSTSKPPSYDITCKIDADLAYLVNIEVRILAYETNRFFLWIINFSESSIRPDQAQLLFDLHQQTYTAAWRWDMNTGHFKATDNLFLLFSLDQKQQQTDGSYNIISLLEQSPLIEEVDKLRRAIIEVRKLRKVYVILLDQSGRNKHNKVAFTIEPVVENGKMKEIFGVVMILDEEGDQQITSFPSLASICIQQLFAPVIWIKKSGKITYANNATSSALQYSNEELLKFKISDIDVETTPSQWMQYWKKLKRGEQLVIEGSLQREDRTIFFAELHLRFIKSNKQELICIIANDISDRRLKETHLQSSIMEAKTLREQLEIRENLYQEFLFGNRKFKIVTQDENYSKVLDQVRQVAQTDVAVLILGETGTGKELLAHMVHQLSKRRDLPFVKFNCAALSENVIESELFGHEKGAFTDAYQRKLGRFEVADGGTVFMDEIGELPMSIQAKLLRVLQSGEFERVGGTETVVVDVRIISATNRALEDMIEKQTFRRDLYYRISVFPIYNLPLRERKDDIPVLAEYFLDKFNEKIKKNITTISEEDMERLKEYYFPGNVRELENLIERSVILTNGDVLNLSHWTGDMEGSENVYHKNDQFKTFEEIQKDHIIAALKKAQGKVTGEGSAAELLGLNGKTLASKMRKFKIDRWQFQKP